MVSKETIWNHMVSKETNWFPWNHMVSKETNWFPWNHTIGAFACEQLGCSREQPAASASRRTARQRVVSLRETCSRRELTETSEKNL